MNLDFSKDLKAIIYDLGVDAVYNSRGIKVIFNEAGDIWETSGGLIEYESPSCLCYQEDVLSAQNGDMIQINGKNYYIASIKRSSNGETVLTLSEVELNG